MTGKGTPPECLSLFPSQDLYLYIFVNVTNDGEFNIYCTESLSCDAMEITIIAAVGDMELDYTVSIWCFKEAHIHLCARYQLGTGAFVFTFSPLCEQSGIQVLNETCLNF